MTARKSKLLVPEASDDWKELARCKGVDPELFFPERGFNLGTAAAVAVCALCPVRDPCLDYAIRNREKFGVFGGKSDRARRKWRQHLRVTQAAFEADIHPVVDDLAWSMVGRLEAAS